MPEPDVGTDPWDVPEGGYFSDSGESFLDKLFDFGTSTFRTYTDYLGTDRAYELERLRLTTSYSDDTQPGATGGAFGVSSSTLGTLVVVAVAGVAMFALVKALK